MNHPQKQIIIIEDDSVLRRGLKRFFRMEHYAVLDFEDGYEASEALNDAKSDLILCDYNLPGANGLEILRKLRETGKNTPFFLMTGYYTEELAGLAETKGAAATFEKPIDLDTLRTHCRL